MRAGALAAAATLALCAPSAADWAPPHSVGPGTDASPELDMNVVAATAPDGSAGVAWTDQADGHGEVRFALVRPDGTVVGPEAVSPPGQAARHPQVAIGGDGVAHVAWISAPPGGQARALVARRDPAHGWEAPADLGPSDGVLIATDHTGTTTVARQTVWDAHCGTYTGDVIRSCGLIEVSQIAADGAIRASGTLSSDRETVGLRRLEADPRGGAFLLYGHSVGADPREGLFCPLTLIRFHPDGSFGAPVELGGGFSPRISIAPDGTVAAVWGRGHDQVEVDGGIVTPDGVRQEPARVSASDRTWADGTAVAAASSDGAIFAWDLNDYPVGVFPRYARSGPGGAVGAPATVPHVNPGFSFPDMAARPDGTAILVWWDSHDGLEATTFAADGAPQPARVIAASPNGVTAPVLSTSARSAMVFWRQTDGGRATVMFTREVPDAPAQPGPAALAVAGLSLSRTRFAAAAADTPRSAVARGTVIRFRLSRAATVTLRFAKLTARPPRPGRAPPRTIARPGRAGANAVRFTGRIGHSALTPGRWRVTLTAAAPPDTAPPQARAFTVLPG